LHFGDTIVLRVKNSFNTPTVLFPLLQDGNGIPSNVFLSKENLVNWIRSACDTLPAEDCLMAMAVNRIAPILKSDLFVNRAFPQDLWTHWNSGASDQSAFEQAFAKEFSLMGTLTGTYSTKCGEKSQTAFTMLLATGLMNPDHFRTVGGHNHVYSEIYDHGRWKIVDFDPSTPGLTTVSKLGHEALNELGWPMAAQEIDPWRYRSFYSGEMLYSGSSFATRRDYTFWSGTYFEYYNAISTDTVGEVATPFSFAVSPMHGDIIIPANGYLEVSYKENGFRLDSLANTVHWDSTFAMYGRLQTALANPVDTAQIWAAYYQFVMVESSYFGVSPEEFAQGLESNRFTMAKSDRWFPVFTGATIPSYKLIVPPGYYEIGTDIKAPGRVMRIESGTGSEIYLQDEFGNDTLIIGSNEYEVEFWRRDMSEFVSDFSVSNKVNQYLQRGWVNALDTVRIHVSWNPAMFNFLHGALRIDASGPLEIDYIVNGVNRLHDDMVVGIGSLDGEINVYPNPAEDHINFPMGDATLFDMTGRRVSSCSTCIRISLPSSINAGMYVLRHSKGVTRVLVK